MSFSFNSQINKENNNVEYSIQITTDNKGQYLFMQEMARQCVDGQHKEKQSDAEPYENTALDWKMFYPLDTLGTDIPISCSTEGGE